MKNTAGNLEKQHLQGVTEHTVIEPVPGQPKTYRVTLQLGKISGRLRTRTKTVIGLANARKVAAEMEANRQQLSNGVNTKRSKVGLSLSVVVDKYLRSGKPSWSPKTYTTKKERLHRYLVSFIGADTDITDITPLQLQSFQNDLQDRLAATTCKQIMLTVAAFFAQLFAWKVIEDNPIKALTTIKAKAKTKEIWTPEQVKQVLHSDDCPLFLRLLLVSGCRPEELQALTWTNVDFENCGIRICQVAYYDTDHKNWKVRQGAKNQSSERFIPLDTKTMAALADAKAEKKSQWVVPAERGGIVAITTLRLHFQKWIEKHNLPKITLYALRHSSITYLLEAGVMVKTVAARAGHSNTATTLAHYATVTDSASRAAADIFNQ